ncbi:hypothetical protein QM012_007386 [Aureobasidium pullulans]|uniref:Uncharacterized protein n=1 Tax=Aureobasidium pullulans TaxID=5580 RepID=A0ABR0TMW9_AURPU
MAPILTDRENELLVCLFQCTKAPLEIDLDKFANLTGYKTRASANTAYHKLKAKIGKAETDADDADAVDDAEADAEDTPVASASKKARGKKAAAVKAEEPQTDEDDESETIPVKAKGKAKSARAAPKKASTAQPVRRSARNSLKASKSMIKDDSSADSEEEVPAKRPITLKRGKVVYPTEEEMRIIPSTVTAAEVPATVSEDAATPAKALKRAATDPGSDIDELATDPKRIKVAPAVAPAVEPTESLVETVDTVITSVVSFDPVVETYVVNEPEAVDVSTDIHMAVDDASDVDANGETASDVPSNVASAATSGDHDDI